VARPHVYPADIDRADIDPADIDRAGVYRPDVYRVVYTVVMPLRDLGCAIDVRLATFRCSGAEVRTPVWTAPDGERLVVPGFASTQRGRA